MEELCFLTNVSGEQWAAWAQAVLSAMAIYAAAALANRQHRLERTNEIVDKLNQQAELSEEIGILVKELAGRMEFIFVALQKGDDVGSREDLSAIEDCSRLLKAVPVEDLGSTVISLRLLKARRVADNAVEDLLRLQDWFKRRLHVLAGQEPDHAMTRTVEELRALEADLKDYAKTLNRSTTVALNVAKRWTIFG